ncbi:hypothetical protein V1477_016379 [Vespula maculifrons]|uniref:Uncharacterized protein n=1 Tax=Vespula maculifrons TaxID=7453 RepID=A0ABD2BCV0_VESMC
MRRKIPPERYNNIKKISSKSKNNAGKWWFHEKCGSEESSRAFVKDKLLSALYEMSYINIRPIKDHRVNHISAVKLNFTKFYKFRRTVERLWKPVDGNYVLSRRAQAALLAVVEGILDESLEDAKNLAIMSGKNCVTYEEMEKALKRLCLRLNDHIVIAKNKYDFCITAHESSD